MLLQLKVWNLCYFRCRSETVVTVAEGPKLMFLQLKVWN